MRFKRLLTITGFIFVAFSALAVDRVTANLTFTNAAGTTNGQTLTINGDIRTWTNNVVLASSQILTNSAATGSKTNAYKAIGLAPVAQIVIQDTGATNIAFVANSGVALTVTPSAGYASVTYSTQTVTTMIDVRVPITGEPAGGQQTNISSLLVSGIDSLSTNSFHESSIAVSNLVGRTNSQSISGNKAFSGTSNYVAGAYLSSPTMTNGLNYGNAFRSPGSAANAEQFGTAASAAAESGIAFGNTAAIQSGAQNSIAIGVNSLVYTGASNSVAIGNAGGVVNNAQGSVAVGYSSGVGANSSNSIAIGYQASVALNQTNSVAIGANALTTAANQIRLGVAAHTVSIPGNLNVLGNTTLPVLSGQNTFAAGGDVAFTRFALTSLTTGNNAAIPVGTNVFVEVSGPGGAFTINGIAGGRDGKFLIILNQTGFNMTIAHDSGIDPTIANRIFTMTGADRATTGNGAAMLIYSAAASRWILISLDL